VSDADLIQELRRQISENDRAILEALNTRLELVARIKEVKASRGIAFVDREREQRMLAELERANRGPLTPESLRKIFQEILDLTKREIATGEERRP
jgi:chorismate mutase